MFNPKTHLSYADRFNVMKYLLDYVLYHIRLKGTIDPDNTNQRKGLGVSVNKIAGWLNGGIVRWLEPLNK